MCINLYLYFGTVPKRRLIDIKGGMFAPAADTAFLTVGFQGMRAALANPVKLLRSE
jgi:hypothetical protein